MLNKLQKSPAGVIDCSENSDVIVAAIDGNPVLTYRKSVVSAPNGVDFWNQADKQGSVSHESVADVAATQGIRAITVNGHASEVHAFSFEEQQRLLAFSLDEVAGKVPLINGVYADGSLQAATIAKMAEREGAAALLVFPPNCMSMGGHLRPEMAQTHFKTVCDATDLPIILFQYPGPSGLQYPIDTLVKIIESCPQIRDMHNRMKECLVLLGKLPKAVVRPPLMKLTEADASASSRPEGPLLRRFTPTQLSPVSECSLAM